MINYFEKHNKISLVITILIALIIFYLSSLSFEPATQKTSIYSTIYHFCAFFFLALFLLIALVKGKEKYLILFLGVLISIIYSVFDELHQFFVPGRHCSFSDIFVDTTGILFASLIYLISIKLKKNVIHSHKV